MRSPYVKPPTKSTEAQGLTRRTLGGSQVDLMSGSLIKDNDSDSKFNTTSSYSLPAYSSSSKTSVDWQSVLNMVNGVLGAGVLGYPYCFKQCGFVLTTILLVVCFLACQVTMRLLLECSAICGKRTYESVAKACMGVWGERLLKVCVAVLNIGALVAYINILSDILSSVAGTMIPPALEPTRKTVMVGVTLLGLLPIGLLVTDASRLSSVSSFSVGMVFLFSVAMCVFALSPIQDAYPVKYFRLDGVAIAFPVVGYGFAAHTILFPIYNTMKTPNTQQMSKVLKVSGLINACVYLVVGCAGYIAFRQRVHGDILRNLGNVSDTQLIQSAYQYALKLGYGASILGCIPLVLMTLHPTFFFLFQYGSSDKEREKQEGGKRKGDGHLFIKNCITVCLVFLALMIAIVVPNVEFIFGLVGATATVMVAYILPATFYILLTRSQTDTKMARSYANRTKMVRLVCVLMILFGASVGFMGTRATLTAVQEEAEVVELASKLVQQSQVVYQAEEAQKKVNEVVDAVQMVDSISKELSAAHAGAEEAVGQAKKVEEALTKLDGDGSQVAVWDIKGQLDKITGYTEEKTIQEVQENLKAASEKVVDTVKNLETLTKNLEQQKANQTAASEDATTQSVVTTSQEAKEDAAQAQEDNSLKARAVEIAQQLTQSQKQENAEQSVADVMTKEQLQVVQKRANMTLQELKRTANVLQLLETAAQQMTLIRQGKQGSEVQKASVDLLRDAISQTLESQRSINTTMGLLRGIAQTQTSELLKLVLDMARDVSEQADQKLIAQQEEQKLKEEQQQIESLKGPVVKAANASEPQTNVTQDESQIVSQASVAGSTEEVDVIEQTSHKLVQQLMEVAKLVEGGISLSQVDKEMNTTWLVAAAEAAKDVASSTANSAKEDMKAAVQKEAAKMDSDSGSESDDDQQTQSQRKKVSVKDTDVGTNSSQSLGLQNRETAKHTRSRPINNNKINSVKGYQNSTSIRLNISDIARSQQFQQALQEKLKKQLGDVVIKKGENDVAKNGMGRKSLPQQVDPVQ